jgi:hypothetical protein
MEDYIFILATLSIISLVLAIARSYFKGPVCKVRPDLKNTIVFITGANTGLGA